MSWLNFVCFNFVFFAVYKGTYIELLVSADLIYQENVKSGSMQGGQDLPMSQVDQAYDDDHWNIVLVSTYFFTGMDKTFQFYS